MPGLPTNRMLRTRLVPPWIRIAAQLAACAAVTIGDRVASAQPAASASSSASAAQQDEDDEALQPAPNMNPFGTPNGRLRDYREPLLGTLRACSFRKNVCVSGRKSASILQVLAQAEQLVDTLAAQLGADPLDHGTLLHPTEITLLAAAGTEPTPAVLERPALQRIDLRGGFDRAEYAIEVDEAAVGSRIGDANLARELAKLAILRFAPATDDASLAAVSGALAFRLNAAARGIGEFDALYMIAHPERTPWRYFAAGERPLETPGERRVLGAARASAWGGGAWFFDWLDSSYGREPGRLLLALAALGPSKTDLGAARWAAEPDVLDVLRITAKDVRFKQSKFEDLWLDYAIDVAILGKQDLPHYPESAGVRAAFSRVLHTQLAWDVPFPTANRRLLGPAPLEPLGMTFHRVGVKNPSPGLRAEFEWEGYSRMRWAFVAFDEGGKVVARRPIPVAEKAIFAGASLVNADNAKEVWLVGTALGDPRTPFDPDDEYFEAHGYTVTLGENHY